MLNKRSAPEIAFDMVNYTLMLVLMLLTLYPFIYVAFASVSDSNALVMHRGLLYKPLGLNFDAYGRVFNNRMVMKGYLNTLFYVGAGTAVNMILTSLGAYVLSRKQLYWKKAIMIFVVATMFFSGGLIPFYLIVKGLTLSDTVWAVILPVAISTWNLIIMRTSFAGIPDSMEESAKVDGANDLVVLFRIILPVSMPIVAVMILFYGVGRWNDWFNAMIFLRKRELYPLQLILREILVMNSVDSMTGNIKNADRLSVGESIKYATIMVATVPVLFIYPFLQKYFVQGIMIGALKE